MIKDIIKIIMNLVFLQVIISEPFLIKVIGFNTHIDYLREKIPKNKNLR